ncbi:polysaccharide biosynthesis/export family protein [Bythopirellula polymerisocia]|uniref:Polysaccharide biosynthesis/export protein n=1 Tax=Bythopirellula polymerisocia TaxID=2528003 RepID=A0A5C6CY87_9BACT|nr:polysaccharide biosynthesis/export family protein [Bythopirellula polymerisocia]TWU29368.1 Polysaccharide biosynthesis/export protein [Bythopirellula polymerisocia]
MKAYSPFNAFILLTTIAVAIGLDPMCHAQVSPCNAQCVDPAAPFPIWGVDSTAGCGCGEVDWKARGYINWQAYAQGEYVGHARTPHVPEYRIRVDDQIAFVFRLTREETSNPYELEVGDRIRVESLTADSGGGTADAEGGSSGDRISRELVIQPDGTISLPLLGQVRAARMTVDGLRQYLEQRYQKYYKVPAITVTPIEVNTRLNDLIESVDARFGAGGLRLTLTVTPAGKLYMPGLGVIYAQGLTLEELRNEIDARYDAAIPGVDVTPVLQQRAPRYCYVLGEVPRPGQFELKGPTTLMGAIAMAGGWNTGANLRQVVVFRRGDDWRLMATMLDIKGALYARRPGPADEIWLNDSDIIVLPKTCIQATDDVINQYFTRGLYSLFPQFAFGQFGFNNFRELDVQ